MYVQVSIISQVLPFSSHLLPWLAKLPTQHKVVKLLNVIHLCRSILRNKHPGKVIL